MIVALKVFAQSFTIFVQKVLFHLLGHSAAILEMLQ